jgi:hypothetical protein
MRSLAAALLILLALVFAVSGGRRFVRGVTRAAALDVIRGIRGCVIALVSGIFALGALSGEAGWLWLGALILAEELYETGLLAALIEHHPVEAAHDGL